MSAPNPYCHLLAADVGNFMRSPVRDIFKQVDMNEVYWMAGGYPSADAFDIEGVRQAASQVLGRHGARALQYGPTQGVPELRRAIAVREGVGAECVQVTCSSQQGIDVCARVLLNPGDVVLTTNPTYLGALQSFASYRARVVGIGYLADDQAWIAAWQQALDRCRQQGATVKMVYIIPDFSNPSGECLQLGKRRLLAAWARRNGLVIVEDAPYRELRYQGEPVPTLHSLDPGVVLHLGSCSKVLAPGLRIGWILGPEQLLDPIYVCLQSLTLCPSTLNQLIAAHMMASGALDRNLQRVRGLYSERCSAMQQALRRHMPQGVSWTQPQGGLFLLLTLPQAFDSWRFYQRALDGGVAYVAGSLFHTDGGGANTMRLNFSFMNTTRIAQGIERLAQLVREELHLPS